MKIRIERVKQGSSAPMDLLVLADPSKKLIRKTLQSGECYVAKKSGGAVVGVIVLLDTKPGTMEIMYIAVRPAYQRKGIGKQLIRFVVKRARKKNKRTMEIGTGNPGVHQMLLYQKCGFRITGVVSDYFRKNHKKRIYENGIECRDMIRLKMELKKAKIKPCAAVNLQK